MKSGFRKNSIDKLAEPHLADKVHRATVHTTQKRADLVGQMPAFEVLRNRGQEARLRSLDRHSQLKADFIAQVEARGAKVHLAATASEATALIIKLVKEVGNRVTKSKSMTSEEIDLNAALEQASVHVKETDLGELIVQLSSQRPSHVTAPAIHLSAQDIAIIFRDKLGMKIPAWVGVESPTPQARFALARDLSLFAREHLREHFFNADVGISGANFLVSESGTIVLLENEGNIQLTTCLPKRHIVLAGIDKLIESERDLGVLLRLLPVSATAQRQTCYVSLFADSHPDRHIVLLDNGRSQLLAHASQRDLLTCIRCGACMNTCPIYRHVGGHAYDAPYPGPIGALLMPMLDSSGRYDDLPFASSLCGACDAVCPVRIPITRRLLQQRASLASEKRSKYGTTMNLLATTMRDARHMERAVSLLPVASHLAFLHPAPRSWGQSREIPKVRGGTFRSWWLSRKASARAPQEFQLEASGLEHRAQSLLPLTPEPLGHLENLELFTSRLQDLGPNGETELHPFDSARACIEFLRIRMEGMTPSDVLIQGEPSEKRTYRLGISKAVVMIADSGGLVLDFPTSHDEHSASLVETHIVIAQPSTLVSSVAHALVVRSVKRKAGKWGDFQVIVTGPSRTADVEKVLVIPAHGPQRLVVVLCEDDVDVASVRS